MPVTIQSWVENPSDLQPNLQHPPRTFCFKSALYLHTYLLICCHALNRTALLSYIQPVVKVRGASLARGLSPCSGLSPLLLMKKCYFMHKMCQIPHPNRRLRPMSPLLDLVTLTTAYNAVLVARGLQLQPMPIHQLFGLLSCIVHA